MIVGFFPISLPATIDVKKNIFDLCTDSKDCYLAVIEVSLVMLHFEYVESISSSASLERSIQGAGEEGSLGGRISDSGGAMGFSSRPWNNGPALHPQQSPERAWEFAQPVYMCFVYLEKAFVRVPWGVPWGGASAISRIKPPDTGCSVAVPQMSELVSQICFQ